MPMNEFCGPGRHHSLGCSDGNGFFARPCPHCRRQKPLDEKHAAIYNLPVGSLVPQKLEPEVSAEDLEELSLPEPRDGRRRPMRSRRLG